ncbi:MAG: enoyl-CoA hydratase/isomerase family protein [Gammaproteobacteria bacterium]|nr:MAG: enoyl-CoA hydratase/isomerase family protein [Gammaproteobacteria bacterium]
MTARDTPLIVERHDSVVWLRINRPASRNALCRKTLAALGSAFAAAATDPALKAAVLSGEGDEAFAAGGDLKELSSVRSPGQAAELFDIASTALDELRHFPVPVIAALNGLALGGGAELALACDFRVAAAHAKIGYIQAQLNISPGFGGGADVMRLLGPSRAMLHCLTGVPLDARQAHAAGLVDQVAAEGESLACSVARFLEPILAQTAQVIRAYKAIAIAERLGLPLAERRKLERDSFAATWTHPDHWAAVNAFTEAKQRRRCERSGRPGVEHEP